MKLSNNAQKINLIRTTDLRWSKVGAFVQNLHKYFNSLYRKRKDFNLTSHEVMGQNTFHKGRFRV